MKKETFVVYGEGNQHLHVRRFSSDVEPKGVIQILHGKSEYGDRYDELAEALVDQGYRVYVHDHRKHGFSIAGSQKVGVFTDDTWKQMVEDVNHVQQEILKRESVDKVMMLGHSMGSFLLRNFLIDHGEHVEKAVVCGTADTPVPLSRVATLLARVIGRFTGHKRSQFLENMAVGGFNKPFEPNETTVDWLTRDTGVNRWFEESPLCGYAYTPKYYEELTKGLLYIIKDDNMAKTPNIPLLFVAGDKDPVGDMGEGVKRVHDKYKTMGYDTQLTLFKDARHEILNDLCKQEVYERVIEFFA